MTAVDAAAVFHATPPDHPAVSDAMFAEAFENATTPRALLCADGTIVRANRRLGEFLGVAPDRLAGRDLGAFAHPDDRSRLSALGQPTGQHVEARFISASGLERIGEVITYTIGRHGGCTAGLAMELHDVTVRIEMLTALRESESRLALALESSGVGLWDWNVETGTLFFSDEWAAVFGYAKFTHTFAAWEANVHPDDLVALTGVLARHLAGDTESFRAEYRVKRADGTWAWVDARGRIVRRTAAGAPRRLVGTMFDVTARHEAQEEQRLLQEQMQRAQKLESLGVLAGGIAHDFNNLLTTILGNASLARAVVDDGGELAALLDDVELGATRAAELTRQLLAYAGKGRFVVRPLDLSALIREMSALLHAAVSKGARLDLQLAPDLLTISGDASQLRQVVMNLVTNASDALGDGDGVITIRTGVVRHYSSPGNGEPSSLPDHFVFVDIDDTGCGMDDGTKGRIFEPFFTTKAAGRGLGLPATRGIVQGHQGKIHVRSGNGQGTSVRLLFPAGQSVVGDRPAARPATDAWRGSGTALVVDDEDGVRTVAQRLLVNLGFDVLQAVDGLHALQVYEAHRADIRFVLLDLTMPRMGGAETLAELRRRDSQLPVIVTSGYSESELGVPLSGAAAVGFVQKPFARTVLARAVRQAVGA